MATHKRSLDCDSHDSLHDIESKRMKIDSLHILQFSDCLLTIILSYLEAYDLYHLSKTCRRFSYLVQEKKLWRRLNLLEHPMCFRKFKFFYNNINFLTNTILVRGIKKTEKSLTFAQFITLDNICDNLSVMAIENQYINSDEIVLKDFPETLTELSLRNTRVHGERSFLGDAHTRLQKLHTLILDDCNWFNEHSLMALSKLPNLENLSLYKCTNLYDSVAYMSITTKFGFRKLLRIDARWTAIGDQFLKCFHSIKTLREIYLESPPRQGSKSKELFEEIIRLCGGSDILDDSPAVVFSQNNILKLRKEKSKSRKKKNIPQVQIFANFDCVEECKDCSTDTCSVIANYHGQYSPKIKSKVENDIQVNFSLSKSTSIEVVTINRREQNQKASLFLNSSSVNKIVGAADTAGSSNHANVNPSEISEKMYYTSDTDDEILDLDLESDVTDSGVEWFCSADPNCDDNLGQTSVLFRKPYNKCSCSAHDNNADFSSPGPSGLCAVKPPVNLVSDDSSSSTTNSGDTDFGSLSFSPRCMSNISSSSSGVGSNSASSSSSASDSERPTSSNDLSVNLSGQGSVCFKIAYAPQAFEEQRRDLRVIIERLDPGVHIIYDHQIRDNIEASNTTRLKVLVARGYKFITNRALHSLQDLRLELLDVTGTSVTAKGVHDFLMLNPDCRVIHESTCHCNHAF